ncbi:MAG: hypothetical protein NDI61_13275, partial [Bdellovibrionaceae bacterium]|nr:hypothetical protein [Pseudobdellovibrionaceae bacterium]
MFIDRWIRTLIRLFVALAVIAIVAAFFISESRMTVLQAIVDQTCKSENPAKCIIMAKKLSQLRQTELAVSAWTFACERKDAESCWSVGLHHRANNRSDEGHVFLMRACEMNRPDYCRQQATMYFEEQNDKQALYSLSSACHMDDEESC